MRIRKTATYADGKVLAQIALASGEDKPTDGLATGSTIVEADTGKTFVLDEDSATWTEYTTGGGGGGGSEETIQILEGTSVNLIVPSGTTKLRQGSIQLFPNLKTLEITGSVLSIDGTAISNNESLETVTIHEGLTTIGNNFLMSCTNLVTVDLPSTLQSIGAYFFRSAAVQTLICRAVTPPSIGSNSWYQATKPTAVYVPSGSVNSYKSVWAALANVIQAIPE